MADGKGLWSVEKGCFRYGFGSKWRVLELLRSSLACYCVVAMLLAGLRNCSPRVRNCVGFGVIAWTLWPTFKPPTLNSHIFLVRTPIRMFLDSMGRSLSL